MTTPEVGARARGGCGGGSTRRPTRRSTRLRSSSGASSARRAGHEQALSALRGHGRNGH